LSAELGFWIPIVGGISDSLSGIPDSKGPDSGFHKEKFSRFRIVREKFPGFLILQAKIPLMDSGTRVPLHGEKNPL